MTAFAPPLGEPPAVQFFTPDRLSVDHTYQRQLHSGRSQKLVFAIAQSWDWRLCTPLLVSERPDGLFILDGQHRWAAAKLRGDIPFLPCAVGRFSSVAEEAMLFVSANRKRVQVSRIDLFRAGLAAGHEQEQQISELVAAAGLKIAAHTNPKQYGPGELGCTSTMFAALRAQGTKTLGSALCALGEAFEGEVLTYSGVLLKALVLLLQVPPASFDRQLLIETLRKRSADHWAQHPKVAIAQGGERRAGALRYVIVEQMGLSYEPRTKAQPTPTKRARTFEEQLAAVESGEARVVPKIAISRPAPDQTLGGVATAML